MATMYELLSSQPRHTPGQRSTPTAQFDTVQLRARDYFLPVQRNCRNRLERPHRAARRKKGTKQGAAEGDKQEGAKRRERGEGGEVHNRGQRVRVAAGRQQGHSETEEEEGEDEGEVEAKNDSKSVTSSLRHPVQVKERPEDRAGQVRNYYERYCERAGLVPLGLFMRQAGGYTLDLHFNAIGDDGLKVLAVPIAMWAQLYAVNLSTTNIGDSGARSLMLALAATDELRELNLSDNQITAKGGSHICRYIEQSKNIRSINLSGNRKLGDVFAVELSEALDNTEGLLSSLCVADCGLGEEAGRRLGVALEMQDTLTDLDLSWNHIRLSGAVAIAKGVQNNDTLLRLDVSWNGFSYEGAVALAQSLTSNKSLIKLNLTNNRFVDKSIYKLTMGLKVNDGLQVLKVDKNPFSPEAALGLIKAIIENPNSALRKLDIKEIPVKEAFLTALSSLREARPDFVCAHHMYQRGGDEDGKKSAFELLFEHLFQADKDPKNIFKINDSQEEPVFINKTAFIDQLKEAQTPLTEFQVTEIANIAESRDGSAVNVGYIFTRWAQFIEDKKSAH